MDKWINKLLHPYELILVSKTNEQITEAYNYLDKPPGHYAE